MFVKTASCYLVFQSKLEKEVFLQLIGVSGIGAKVGLSILSTLPANRLVQAIQTGDVALICESPGVGKRTGERLITELRDRISKLSAATPSPIPSRLPGLNANADVISALLNLGYKRPAAEQAVAQLNSTDDQPFDTMLKEALKSLTP